jgi:serine/threonine-protein kinase HipA
MAESKIERVSGSHYTFFTKRFDREQNERIHFASAMTMTGNNEEVIRDNQPSYLEIAEFIQFSGADVAKNLRQLWRRIVFNIAISNTDDHLRNHGFILTPKGWILSPAFDINPSIDKNGLSLNIDQYDNSLDIDLAITVGANFQLEINEMNRIIDEVLSSVANWKKIAKDIGINPLEQEIMESAFRVLK